MKLRQQHLRVPQEWYVRRPLVATPGAHNRHIIAAVIVGRIEYSLHATKGYRAARAS